MIEIIVVALLCTWVSKTARNKGKSVGAYVAMTLGLWFGLEILGVVIGLAAFDEFYPAYGLGLGGAVLGGIIAAVIVSSAKPAPGFVAPGQMPYYPQGQMPYPPGQVPYYPPQQGQMPYPPGQVPYYPPVSSQPQPQSQSQAAVTPAPAPGSQVCAGCGTPNGPDAAFCFRCGKPLK
jgi:hypothetical protein